MLVYIFRSDDSECLVSLVKIELFSPITCRTSR